MPMVLNKLFKTYSITILFSINNVALVKGRPRLLCLRDLLFNYLLNIVMKLLFVVLLSIELMKAKERAHIVQGLVIASDNIDEVIAIIKGQILPMMQWIS